MSSQRGGSGSQLLLGIDLGGNALRIATAVGGVPRLLFVRPVPLVEARTTTAATRREGGILAPLKRSVEYEAEVYVSDEWQSSMDYLGRIVSEAVAALSLSGRVEDQRCVVAVPPCFSQRQRSVVSDAIQQALPSRVRLVDDTLAALVACRDRLPSQERTLVFSWGDSALSVALYDNMKGKARLVATEGDPLSGGFEITSAVVKRTSATGEARIEHQTAQSDTARLYAAAEDAKLRILHNGATVRSPQAAPSASTSEIGPAADEAVRADVARVLEAMVVKALSLVDAALKTSGWTAPDSVLLTGGMTRIPQVRDALLSRLAVPATEADEREVATGAVLCAALLDEAGWEASTDERRTSRITVLPSAKRSSRWADNFTPMLDEAQAHADAGRIADAVSSFDRLFGELGIFSSTLYRQLAVAKHSQGDDDSAYALLRAANQRAPHDEGLARDFLRCCYDCGVGAYKTGRFDRAIALADELVTAAEAASRKSKSVVWGDTVGHGLWLKSLALVGKGDAVSAQSLMKQAIDLLPPKPEYRKTLQELEEAMRAPSRKVIRSKTVTRKPHRNDPCSCGSGKKLKRCCGQVKRG